MKFIPRRVSSSLVCLVLAVVGLSARQAHAVPSFARQTGMACAQCHTVFPELTPFGRQFKAGGYTLTTTKQITTPPEEDKRPMLELPANVPLGVMFVTGFTHTSAAQQVAAGAPAKNDDVSFPQQFSLFYGGKIAPMVGAFVQVTYTGPEDKFTFDNTDIRLAHSFDVAGKPLIVGATLNNNPTVSDLWNSTPAWGAPFTSSASAPTPSASTLIEGGLAQSSIGGGVYGYYNGWLDVYAEVDAYRSSPLGVPIPLDASTGATGVIDGFAPYWRVALEKARGNQTLMLGTFGITGSLLLGGTDSAGTALTLARPGDRYTDVGIDAQYQYIGERHIATATLTYIHQSLWLDGSRAAGLADNPYNDLHSFKASLSYIFDRTLGGRFTVASMRGSGDSTFYGGQGPSATSFTGEVFYTPWYNTKLGVMYTAYSSFNGASTNYDGNGRNAGDNNTFYAYLWLAF